MASPLRGLLLPAMLVSAGMAVLAADEKSASVINSRTTTKEGIRMDVRIEPVAGNDASAFHEGDDVRIRVHLQEQTGGTALRGLKPGAWLDKGEASPGTPESCLAKVRGYYEGSTFRHALVDLTSHLVVVLNDDATISVVDPRFGFGDTKLVALIQLPSPGEDWVVDHNDDFIYVSLPASHQVAVVDTASWKVAALLNAGLEPTRLALQPDGAYLWVGDDKGGVIAIRTADRKVAGSIPTGAGPHQLAISADSALVFVSNSAAGTVSVIQTGKLAKLKDLQAGKSPGSLSYSPLAKSLYVVSAPDGLISAFGGTDYGLLRQVTVDPGINQVRFEPKGRYALILNPIADRLHVFDSANNRLMQTAKTEKGPNQLAFSNKLVFIRHSGSDTVLMVPFDSLGKDEPIAAADFTGGNHAPGSMRRLAAADGIVQASAEDAVLVANPGDRAVYFYMEGMAAPMGNFATFGKEPRAVTVVERNLRERKPGDYETVVRLPAAGQFDLAIFVDKPRVLQCLGLSATPSRAAEQSVKLPHVELLPLAAAPPGQPFEIRFRVTDPADGKPLVNLADFVILLIGPGASWQIREIASHQGDGIYSAKILPSDDGAFTIFAAAPGEGLAFAQYGASRAPQ